MTISDRISVGKESQSFGSEKLLRIISELQSRGDRLSRLWSKKESMGMILHAPKHMGQMIGVSTGMFVEHYKLGEMLKVGF